MFSVLVADDNESWLEALTDVLGREPSFQVVASVRDGNAALEQIEALLPDVIVLDMVMPGRDGTAIAQHIRGSMPGYQPILYLLSGMDSSRIADKLSQLSVDCYSTKPVPLTAVLRNLNKLVAHKQEQQAAPFPPDSAAIRRTAVQGVLTELGLPPELQCSRYMGECLVWYGEQPARFYRWLGPLYRMVADKVLDSPGAVKKAIRVGIKSAQTTASPLYRRIFWDYRPDKITHGIFFSVVSAYVDSVATQDNHIC